MAHDVGIAIAWLNAEDSVSPITIYIDSNGGEVMAGLHIYDAIKNSEASTIGIVYRRANSAASIVLQGCAKRQIMKNAGVLIHHIRVRELPLDKIEDDPEKAFQESHALQKRLNEIYQERTRRSVKEIKDIMRDEVLMTAEEALDFGLVDEII